MFIKLKFHYKASSISQSPTRTYPPYQSLTGTYSASQTPYMNHPVNQPLPTTHDLPCLPDPRPSTSPCQQPTTYPADEGEHHEVGDEEGAATVLISGHGEPPDVAQPDRHGDAGEEEFYGARPLLSLLLWNVLSTTQQMLGLGNTKVV